MDDNHTATLKSIDPEKLKNHPLSFKIYGEDNNDEFDLGVKLNGIHQPIVVAADGLTIVSGHRRKNAARKAGFKKVQIVVRSDLVDDLDIKAAVIDSNDQRDKTVEQKAREFTARKEIEEGRAKRRQSTSTGGGDPQLVRNSAQAEDPPQNPGKSGKSRTIAAEGLGISADTAEKAAEVVLAIDEAESKGDTETAQTLRAALNTQSVSAATRLSKRAKAFSVLPKGIKDQITANPEIASDKAVIKLATMSTGEWQVIQRDVRVGKHPTFDAALGLKSGKQKSNGKADPTPEPEKEQWEQWKVVHEKAVKDINRMVRELKAITEVPLGEYVAISFTRIQSALYDAKAAIWQQMPMDLKKGKIVTRGDEQRSKK